MRAEARQALQRNRAIAARLREMATLLRQQRGNPFRVNAYEQAADTVDSLDEQLVELLEREGFTGLVALAGIGRGIAAAIVEIIESGRWVQLERLRGGPEPERLFETLPGIGPALARKIHDELGVDTLEGLEVAAHDGRLEAIPGLGRRRALAVRSSLQTMLGREQRARSAHRGEPHISVLLDVDHEYLTRSVADGLPTIAPRRFNPEREAWLPILHTRRGDWHFTALFSNTARAHQLERTRDWVVIYFYDSHHREGQRTVVTEMRGSLAGRRVVRGLENACRTHYLRGTA